jgi:hypothetical protein
MPALAGEDEAWDMDGHEVRPRPWDYTTALLLAGTTGTGRTMTSGSPSLGRALARHATALLPALACGLLAWVLHDAVSVSSAVWTPQVSDHPGFAPVDPVAVQQAWPEYLNGLAHPNPLAGAIAVALVFLGVRHLTGSALSAAAAALSMAFGSMFWARSAAGHPATTGAALGLASALALERWWSGATASRMIGAAGAFAACVAVQPAALLALPCALLVPGAARHVAASRRVAMGALTAAAAVAGLVVAAWLIPGAGNTVGWWLPHGSAGVARRAAEAGGVLVADFGVLGLGCVAAGLVALARDRSPSAWIVSTWCVCLCAGSLVWAPPDWRSAAMTGLAPLWLVAGAGMAWAIRDSGARRAAVALVVALPIMNAVDHAWAGARVRAAGLWAGAYLDVMARELPANAVLVAEGGIIDRLAARDARSTGRWERAAQDPDQIQALLDAGRPVIAFGGARANLKELGFRFAPIAAAVPVTLEELIETIPAGWIVAVAGGTEFGRWLPSRDKPGLTTVGGTWRHFGSRAGYALIGVKEREASVESIGADADVKVTAGDAAGPARRWPASVRAASDGRGGSIEYGERVVATTATGLAVAVVSSTGALAGTFEAEAADGFMLRVAPVAFQASRVVGREPCATVGADVWTDVSTQASFASLGTLVNADQHLRVYVAADRRLTPRRHPIRRGQASVSVSLFDRSVSGDREALRRTLDADGLAAPAALGSSPYVARLDITSEGRSRSQAAVRLGGFASVATARLLRAGAARRVAVCSAMRGRGDLLAGTPSGAGGLFDLSDGDLLPRGWDRLEFNGPRVRRWTRARRADVLIPLARPATLELELELEPAAPSGTRFGVIVNGHALPETPLPPGIQVYRVTVPAEVWRPGMNRVQLSSATLHRPSADGNSRDDRELGVAVSVLRLSTPGAGTGEDPPAGPGG